MAYGISVPRPGIEPTSPALEGGFLTTGPPGKSLEILILMCWDFVGFYDFIFYILFKKSSIPTVERYSPIYSSKNFYSFFIPI